MHPTLLLKRVHSQRELWPAPENVGTGYSENKSWIYKNSIAGEELILHVRENKETAQKETALSALRKLREVA